MRNTLSTTQLKLYNKLITYFASTQSENENICQSIRFVTVDFLRFLRPFFFHLLLLRFFSRSFARWFIQSFSEIPNGRIQNENLLHRRYCYSIECCCCESRRSTVKRKKNSRKKNLFEHKFKKCSCYFCSAVDTFVCDPFFLLSSSHSYTHFGLPFPAVSCSFLAQPLQKSQIN